MNMNVQYKGAVRILCVLCRYKGTWDAFHSIVKSEGVLGLWKGWVPNCQRAAIVCLGGTCICKPIEIHVYIILCRLLQLLDLTYMYM